MGKHTHTPRKRVSRKACALASATILAATAAGSLLTAAGADAQPISLSRCYEIGVFKGRLRAVNNAPFPDGLYFPMPVPAPCAVAFGRGYQDGYSSGLRLPREPKLPE